MKNITDELQKIIKQHPDMWTKQTLKKGIVFNTAGSFPTQNYYLETGIVKAFINNEDKQKEVIIGFLSSDAAIFSYRGSWNKAPSLYNLEVIVDADVYVINSKNWDTLAKQKPVMNQFLQIGVHWVLKSFAEYIKINSYPTALERFIEYKKIYPFLSALNNEIVASFMGVSPRTIADVKSQAK